MTPTMVDTIESNGLADPVPSLKKYHCEKCDKVMFRTSYKAHFLVCTHVPRHTCPCCKRVYHHKYSLSRHTKVCASPTNITQRGTQLNDNNNNNIMDNDNYINNNKPSTT